MKSGLKNRLVLILIEVALWAAFVLTMAWLWSRWFTPGPHGPIHWVGMDFVPYWVGVRAMFHGQSPYSPATTQAIQSILLGGAPEAGGDPMLFVYPAWIFPLLAPLAALPLPWAVALWTGTIFFGMLHLIGFLAIRWGAGRPLSTFFWALLLTIGCLPYLSISVSKGQLGLVSMGALLLANRLWKRQGLLAGILLGLAILKPTVTIIPTIGLLVLALWEREKWILAGFGLWMGFSVISSCLAVGNWVPDYLQVLGSAGGAPILWSLSILPWPWKGLYALGFAGLVVYAFVQLLRRHDRESWFSATVLAGFALFPMRWIYDLMQGVLVPSGARNLRKTLAVCVAVALLAPWALALFPPTLRWPAQVIGLPLAWAIVWFVQFNPLHSLQIHKIGSKMR